MAIHKKLKKWRVRVLNLSNECINLSGGGRLLYAGVEHAPRRHLANDIENKITNIRLAELRYGHYLHIWSTDGAEAKTLTRTHLPSSENSPVSNTGKLYALNCWEKEFFLPGTHHQNTLIRASALEVTNHFWRNLSLLLTFLYLIDCVIVLCIVSCVSMY